VCVCVCVCVCVLAIVSFLAEMKNLVLVGLYTTYRQMKVTTSTVELLLLPFYLLPLCQLMIVHQQDSYL